MKQEFYYPSGDGQTKIHGIVWRPETDVKAVLQICHGMVEYIDRYNDFAQYLAERGVCVVGHDHLGHGESVQSEEYLGFFHESHGNKYVITDIHRLRRMTEKDYAGVPYFMMGHSMGSFLLRQYLTMRAEGLAGAIIMGTGYMPHGLLAAGQMVCRTIAAVKGWQYRSEFMNQLGMGGYNKQFEPSESTKDWITSDEEMRKKYPGVLVVTNFRYSHADRIMKDWRDFFEIRNGTDGVIFAIDEIHSEYSSASWKDFPESLLSEISMQRKQRIKIVATAQVFARVAKPIREQSFSVVCCDSYLGRFTRNREYDAAEYCTADTPYQVRKKCRPISRRSFVQSDELRACYDTWEKVERLKRTEFLPRAER